MKDLNQLNTGQKFFLRHQGANFKNDREKHDFYATPEIATLSLLDKEKFTGNIWKCACGDGAISKVLKNKNYKVYSSDLINRGYGDETIDFLNTNKKFDNIITNPPFSLSQKFVEHGLKSINNKLAILNKLSFLEGIKRKPFFLNTPLKSVYVFSFRIPYLKGGINATKRGSVMAFAWFIWEKDYNGKPTIDWI